MQLLRLKNISLLARLGLVALLFFLSSCADVKKALVHDYPKQIPFVFDNKILIKDADNKASQQNLTLDLNNYWDDSLQVKRIRQFGLFSTVIQPIRYQPERMARTMQYMQAFLASKGYNQTVLSPQVTTDTINNEWRTKLTMWVNLNKKTILDTITYALNQPALQKLALANKVNSYLKKGAAFSNENVNNELDRLVELFRSNGYYYFTKEKIFAEIDTVDQSLMQLKLDPLDQMNQLIAANQNKEKNPSWKVNIQLRNTNASTTKVYPIGQQIFYSDLKLSDNPDSILVNSLPQTEILDDISQSFTHPKFKSSLFAEQAILKKGELFNEPKFYQTLNKLSNLGAWQQIDARTTIQNDSVYLHYFLVPYLRRSFSFDLEGSRNTSQLSAGNLLGLSANVTYRDKNVLQKSIPSITSFRTGIELNVNNNNENLTQTLLWNVGHTYSFPSLLIPFKDKNTSNNNNARTNFSLNSAYIDRLNYYQLKSFTTSWGYEWKKNKKAKEISIIYKPLNVEFYQINKFSKLDSLLLLNPFLRSSFNEGNVISQSLNYISSGNAENNANEKTYVRLGIEEAGGLLGLTSMKSNMYRYLKLEAEIRKVYKFEYTELAWRAMGGWGNNYSNESSLSGQLPFFKQFTAGGPYSMRAWGLRQLGLGSSNFYDTSAKSQNFDRFGDLQLEANIEYRFPLFQVSSYKVASALYTDMGNIWNARDTQQDPNAGFKLDRLYHDLAIGVGTGIRIDFNYFTIRIDYAMKLKDPTRLYNNGWLDLQNFKWSEVKPNGIKVNNYALQFGIGLPF